MTWNRKNAKDMAAYNLAWRRANPTNHKNWLKRTLPFVRYRAKKQGMPFNITAEYVRVPERCPVFDTLLVFSGNKHSQNSPSLDRKIPHLGYIKGNVVVISFRANIIKNNATSAEVQRVANWMAGEGL